MLKNIARNALRPSYLREMTRKASLRIRSTGREVEEAKAWASANAVDMTAWATEVDPDLWREAEEFASAMAADARPRVAALEDAGITMGGGGAYGLLYFLARRLAPERILETGVAAGWSTWAFLAAIETNGRGSLYSSDFPYFRIANPEQYIGYLVPDRLRNPNWHLYTKGDRANLKNILAKEKSFGLVHYDSDKTRAGRQFCVDALRGHLTDRSVLVMDDIGDDLFFRDVLYSPDDAVIFAWEGKYLGMVGKV
ncbi:hypothetical protein GCM10010531_38950 [Blastococcus jejuensis]|uniref:Methyltransferase domain-containing protein n=1 Tax=Blastococcus jejuensis TaxID=351224 RepID=A0ABP6PKR8_9ACTN